MEIIESQKYWRYSSTAELNTVSNKMRCQDNSGIIVLFLKENIRCDPSLELYRQNCSNDWSQHMFLQKNG